jgi:hypothetical protein
MIGQRYVLQLAARLRVGHDREALGRARCELIEYRGRLAQW